MLPRCGRVSKHPTTLPAAPGMGGAPIRRHIPVCRWWLRAAAVAVWMTVLSGGAIADDAGVAGCATIPDDRARLACYDQLAGRPAVPPPAARAASPPLPEDRRQSVAGDFVARYDKPATGGSALAFKWELDEESRFGVLRLRTHKPNYFLFARYTDAPNEAPFSGLAPGGATTDLRNIEAKYQLSFKTKLVQGLFDRRLDLWVALTQQSSWQIYSPSAPFRETNYEPEAMAVLRTDLKLPLGWQWRFVNFGFVHQSNGRGEPLSRSWNRLYAQFGIERGDFSVLIRPWWRLPESSLNDNNPDIVNYLGRGDLLAVWQPSGSGHRFALLARNNLSGTSNRGALQFDWRFPLYRNLKGYLQIFTGYGETLIDYNYRQTTAGIGISLSDWQ